MRSSSRLSVAANVAVALVALSAAAAPASVRAQDAGLGGCEPDGGTPPFLSAANEIFYGCGSLFRSTPPQYFSAIGRFRSAAEKEPRNAVAHYLLGVALLGYDQPDSARAALARAVAIDPAVGARLAPRLAERPELRARVERLLAGGADTPARPAPAAPAPVAPATAAPAAPVARAAFRVGDVVEVRPSGGDWERGVVVAVEDDRGDGSRFVYQVRYEVVRGDPATSTTSRIYPANIRPAGPAPAPTAAPARSTALVLGAYACTHDVWNGPPSARQRVSTPKGSITLRADGTYRYLDNGGTGTYRYDAATGAVAWLSGPVATMRPERTTFRRNLRTAQLDIRMTGVYEWSCGIDLP